MRGVILVLHVKYVLSYLLVFMISLSLSLQDTLYDGSISRDQVAEVAVEALVHPEADYKVVEIVARADAPKKTFPELFGSVKQR